MLIGIIGAPNKGKSTLFSALTLNDVGIADYPFTTIKPNFGIAYVTKECVEKELGVICKPRNSLCTNRIRQIPVNITDVAGLVPDAHLGKGMGNQFLNDLAGASALIHVVDLSGKTDVHGNKSEYSDPVQEVAAIRREIVMWLALIITKHIVPISKRVEGSAALSEILSGFNVRQEQIKQAAEANSLSTTHISWNAEEIYKFSESLLRISKPTVIAANKLDRSKGGELEELKKKLSDYHVIGCSATAELALRKAAKNGIIEYIQGTSEFKIKKEVSGEQKQALDYMANLIKKNNGTGVQEILNTIVFKILDSIVVYPVENENRYTDHFGNVLPDAILIENGSKAIDLAGVIHTDLAKTMLYALDAKKKLRVSKDYVLKDNDVIRIVSTAR